MTLTGVRCVMASLLLPAITAAGGPLVPVRQVGDIDEITLTRDSSRHGSKGSSGNTHDKDTIVEQVIGLHEDGMEFVYDLPKTATPAERAKTWQLPARVFKPFHGPTQLLNAAELEARVDLWLKAAGMTRGACGQLLFTWTVFRIECDPQAVIATVHAFDPGPADVQEGATYQESDVLGSGTWARKTGPEGASFVVVLPANPDAVRRARAGTDVAVGELMKKPVSFDEALAQRSKDNISGTMSLTVNMDSGGSLRRRTKVTTLETRHPDGTTESEMVTETLERRSITRGQ
jgi:hypothetical protein